MNAWDLDMGESIRKQIQKAMDVEPAALDKQVAK